MSCADLPTLRHRRYRAVIVSPHLDDAVFSCGATIAQLVREGPVLVVNLFTRYLAEVKIRGVVLSAARYQEEADAAALLGFESVSLGELDVSFRRPAYKSLGNIFRPPVAEDMAWLPQLRQRLVALLADLRCDQLYVPLGIGWHVDHMLAHALFDAWPGPAEVWYYEDLPYGLLPHATRLRLAELGLQHPAETDASLAAQSSGKAWRQTTLAYARTAMVRNLEPWIIRQLAVPVVAAYLHRLMASHQRAAQTAVPRPWVARTVSIDQEFGLKLQAMALYRSQFSEFFLGIDDGVGSLRRYAAQFHPSAMAERFWRVSP
jgi:LmbE family N-acetylglucosaminyl deacetylase